MIREMHHESLLGYPTTAPPNPATDDSEPIAGPGTSFDETTSSPPAQTSGKLGSFLGVHVPVSMGMFGVILFTKYACVVGATGFYGLLSILALSFLVVIMTTASMCAIFTNGTVGGGGAYYVISRTIGPELGGSIGLLFAFGNVLNAAINFSGAAANVPEVVRWIFPSTASWTWLDIGNDYRVGIVLIAIGFVLVFGLLAWLGPSVFARAALFIYIVLIASILIMLVSLFIVFRFDNLRDNLHFFYRARDYQSPSGDPLACFRGAGFDYFLELGIFFPSVTGIMAGANLSGLLRHPAHAIPVGTFSAMLVVGITYVVLALAISGAATREEILRPANFLTAGGNTSALELIRAPVILIGLFAATLSTGLNSLLGATEILRAVARDRLYTFLNVFAHQNERISSTRSLGTVLVLSMGTIALFKASVQGLAIPVSVTFMLTYALANVSALLPSISGVPNWRPKFRYFWWPVAVLGLLLTILFTILISRIFSAIFLLVLLAGYGYLWYFTPSVNWGAVGTALKFHQLRKYLLQLDGASEHVKLWRPGILLYQPKPQTSESSVVQLANALKKGGLLVLGSSVLGTSDHHLSAFNTFRNQLHLSVRQLDIKAFSSVHLAHDHRSAIINLMTSSGIGPMHPNTLMLELESLGPWPVSRAAAASVVDPPGATAAFTPHDPADCIPVHQLSSIVQDAVLFNLNTLLTFGMGRYDHRVFLAPGPRKAPERPSLSVDTSAPIRAELAFNSKHHAARKYIDLWPDALSLLGTDAAHCEDTFYAVITYADLVSRARKWRGRVGLRIFCTVPPDSDPDTFAAHIISLVTQARLHNAWVCVLSEQEVWSLVEISSSKWRAGEGSRAGADAHSLHTKAQRINALMQVVSSAAPLCFVGVPSPAPAEPGHTDSPLCDWTMAVRALTTDMPPTVLVHGMQTMVAMEM